MAMTDGADHVELRPEARVELSRRGQVPGASEFGLVHAIDGDLEQLVDAINRRHLRMLLCSTIGADTDSAVSHDRLDVILLLLGDSCALLNRCGLAPLLINLRADLAPFPLANIAKGQELLSPLPQTRVSVDLGTCSPTGTMASYIKNKSSKQPGLKYRFRQYCPFLIAKRKDQSG